MKNKLNGRDFITIGIFNAIGIVIYMAASLFILAEMYRRSGGTDTAVPVEVYRQTGTGYRLHHSG